MTVKEPALREIILDILLEVLEKGKYSHVILSQALTKYQYLEKQDRSFIKRVVDGTVEYRIQLDYILNSYSKVKVNKMKPVIRTILRMSAYQICHMDRVPDSAACNEAVKLAEKRGFSGLKGFVNGVLRSISRGKDNLVFPDDSIRYSMPEWLASMWKSTYGEETFRRMMESFLKDRPLMARLCLNRAEKQQILDSLGAQGVTAKDSRYADDVICLEGVDYLEGLEAFREGWLQIQDLSSSLAGDAAGIKDGDYVIDVCGAPGGKSLHVADKLKGTGMVIVRDLTEQKVALIEDNIARSGFTNIRAEVHDALVPDPAWEGRADIVLADLPCSGLGIIGRKPDIKYRMTMEQMEELAALQREILSVVQSYVKPGGKLIYSTCTIDRKENEENAAWFLENYPFDAMNLEGKLGETLNAASLRSGNIQLLPGIHPCDGFFIAAFQKK